MKTLVKEPGKMPEVCLVENNLKALQAIVGGYIEALNFDSVIMIVNEEGNLQGLPHNFDTTNGAIVGTVIFVGQAGADFTDLTDDQIVGLKMAFGYIERLGK